MTDPLYEITPPEAARVFAGGVRVRIVRAGWFRPDAGGFFGVVPRPLWTRFAETDDRGRILARLNLLLVDAGDRRVVVETGTGLQMTARDRDIKGVEGGDPVAALEAVGEDPDSIDFVVVSHLHYDHAGGMLGADGRPAFRNARYVVVETGTGLQMTARDRDIKGVEGGDPVAALEAVGEDPDSIDFVVVSHLHYDHAGGMLGADGKPAFRNARYVVQRDEAQAAHGDELRLAGIMERDQLDVVQAAGQLAEVHGEVELTDGVTVIRTGGHTRGSQAVLLGRGDGSGERGIFFGDLVPTRWQLPIRWTSAYDDYPIEAVEIRRELIPRAADEGWWCYFTHDPGALPIRIDAVDGGFAVRAE